MKKLIVFLIFITFVGGIYFAKMAVDERSGRFYYREDFDRIDRDKWYVGEWKTFFPAYDKVTFRNGIIKLEIKETDRGPFLLSKPFKFSSDKILKIKRRVKMTYANDNFTGGLALFETNNNKLMPAETNASFSVFGNALVLVEYVHNYDNTAIRPGSNVFRVLPRDWQMDSNFQLMEPIFDKWFEEELIYNPSTKKITYNLNDNSYTVDAPEFEREYIRIFMHGYGFYKGHTCEIDWVEVIMEPIAD